MFEMNDDQKALFSALTPLRQKVSLNHIAGMKPAKAHKEAGGTCKDEGNRRKLGNEILSKPDVKAFIESMANHIVNPAIMSRDEMLEDLTDVARVIAPDLTTDGIASLSELKNGFDVKLKAMKQLAELAGYEAPKQIEVLEKESLTPWANISASVDG